MCNAGGYVLLHLVSFLLYYFIYLWWAAKLNWMVIAGSLETLLC